MFAGLVGTAILALALSGVFGVVALGAGWKDRCSVYGPAPAGAFIGERNSLLQEQRSWWPIGTACEWRRADGGGTVWSVNGSFELSAATYGLLLVAVVSAAASAASAPRRDP